MKHTIIILLVAVLAAGAGQTACSASTRKTETETEAATKKEAAHKKVNSGAVTGLIREYNLTEGFEAVSVGGLGLGLIRKKERLWSLWTNFAGLWFSIMKMPIRPKENPSQGG